MFDGGDHDLYQIGYREIQDDPPGEIERHPIYDHVDETLTHDGLGQYDRIDVVQQMFGWGWSVNLQRIYGNTEWRLSLSSMILVCSYTPM